MALAEARERRLLDNNAIGHGRGSERSVSARSVLVTHRWTYSGIGDLLAITRSASDRPGSSLGPRS
jgi:hypothetical protein